jgi:hypothetical protein
LLIANAVEYTWLDYPFFTTQFHSLKMGYIKKGSQLAAFFNAMR